MQLKATTSQDAGVLVEILAKYPRAQLVADIDGSPGLLLDLAKTSLWPAAIPDTMIIKDESTKKIRASSIVSSFIKQSVKNKSLLDFGCGDGSVVAEASRMGAIATGYDIKEYGWDKLPGQKLTTNQADLKGPYDIILLYDVLDHADDPVGLLKQVRSLMGPATKLYVRCHPFTAPHGTHAYFGCNKAFIHLLFSTKELEDLGAKSEPTNVTNNYDGWINEAKLVVKGEPDKISLPVNQFFTDDYILRRIHELNFGDLDYSKELLLQTLSVQFVDYVLTMVQPVVASTTPTDIQWL